MNERKEIRFIDLFSGIGGFRRGLELSGGYRCVWSCDNNKYANQVYTSRFGEEGHHSGDIRKVRASSIPDHDLLCAGFPCQAFSIAGKRRGFKETRGTLFFEIARVARAKRPTLLLLENVRGLLSHDKGQTYATILEVLGSLGYWTEWQTLNSKWFSVPQNRDRVFIIGHLRGRSTRPVFPITKNGGLFTKEKQDKKTVGNVASALRARDYASWYGNFIAGPLTGGGHSGGLHSDMTIIIDPFNKTERRDMIAGAIKTNQGSPTSTGTAIAISAKNPHNKKEKRRFNLSEISRAVNPYRDNQKPLVLRPRNNCILQHALYDPHGLSPTLRGAQHDSSPRIIQNSRVRRLTPVECERLQAFPDKWTEGLSDTQRYRCLGNAVTVNVIEFLGHRIKDSLL